MNLKDYLEQSGKTQVAMADSIGANHGFFNQWVRGIRPIPVRYAIAIEAETQGAVRVEDMLPSINWGVLRNQHAEAA